MKIFADSGDEYEQRIKTPKSQKSKNRIKTEEKHITHKSKIFVDCKDKNQLANDDINNIQPNPFNIFFGNSLNKSSNVISSPIIEKNENTNINNENDNTKKQKKFNLIFSKKSLCKTNDSDNKVFSFNENIKNHKESQSSKISNFDINSPKEMQIMNIHKDKDLKHNKNQRVLISTQDLGKIISKASKNYADDKKLNNIDNNTINNLSNAMRNINNSEKINLNKLYKNEKNYNFNDEEENKEGEDEESSSEDIKIKYGYISSSGSEEERKKKENKKYPQTQSSSKRKRNKSLTYNKNKIKILIQSHQKYRKLSVKENNLETDIFKDNINENKRVNRKCATYIKNNKIYDEMKILQNNNININDYFKKAYNMYISSVCTLAKEIDGEQYQMKIHI